jgi:hypothetical protein
LRPTGNSVGHAAYKPALSIRMRSPLRLISSMVNAGRRVDGATCTHLRANLCEQRLVADARHKADRRSHRAPRRMFLDGVVRSATQLAAIEADARWT